jgi:hypothetical protein
VVTGVHAPGATQARTLVMNMAGPWFGSPRPGQPWAQARVDQMFAAYSISESQRRRDRELALGSTLRAPARPLAAIEQVWDDHNVVDHEQKGMLLHAEFVVSGMLERRGAVTGFFYQSAGDFVRDSDGRLLCVSEPIVPPYENTHYKDFSLFMPYEDLPFGRGTHRLAWKIVIWAHQHPGQRPLRLIQSELVEFDFQVS